MLKPFKYKRYHIYQNRSSTVRLFYNQRNESPKTTIGFIGLGNMGVPMAKRLAELPDTRVLVYDRDPKRLSSLFQELSPPPPSYKPSSPRPDIVPCDSAFQVGYDAPTVVTMVDYTDNFYDMCTSGGGLFNGIYKRQLEQKKRKEKIKKALSLSKNVNQNEKEKEDDILSLKSNNNDHNNNNNNNINIDNNNNNNETNYFDHEFNNPQQNHISNLANLAALALFKESVIINSSTIDFRVFRRLVSQADEQLSVPLIDAPVSGSPKNANLGNLTFMLGARQNEDIVTDRVLPILENLGQNFHYLGRRGDGLIAKLCNNMLMAATMVGVSEGMLLGRMLGIDKHALREVFDASSARCWSNSEYNPYPKTCPDSPASDGYKSGFSSEMMFRDLSLAISAAKDVDLSLYLTPHLHRIYQNLMRSPLRTFDFTSILPLLLDRKRSSRVYLRKDSIEFEEPDDPRRMSHQAHRELRRKRRERRREMEANRFSHKF